MMIVLHTKEDFDGMRAAGKLAARVLDHISPFVKDGVTTGELDDECHRFMLENGATSATLGYNNFPKATCISVNHVVCHGIPGPKVLKNGDILNIDVTVVLNGWFGDTSRMFTVGEISSAARKLIDVAYDSLMLGIEIVRPGITTQNIGCLIQNFVKSRGFSVVRDFCGHGIGRVFHADPQIPHFSISDNTVTVEEGMFFTIEPMVNAGGCGVRVLSDGWTAITKDHSLSAQFEHSIGVTSSGCEIFTIS
ncbi:MAG: type I methionyl aminopeptidase [Holosporales bacterium]|jgi:methionyl aminopeptidase|nr:type I methionyl aminopeptidase [Holosporales bacterium]